MTRDSSRHTHHVRLPFLNFLEPSSHHWKKLAQ